MGSLLFIPGEQPSVATVTNVYVATTGSDLNSGLTPAAPKLTVAGAFALLPSTQSAPFCVHFASGSYAYTAPAEVSQTDDAFIVLAGDGAGQPGDDGMSVTLTDVALAGSTTTILNATVALTANALIGQTIEFTTGALTGIRRSVKANSTTQITTTQAFTNSAGTATAPAAGDAYRIVRPAVIFTTIAANTVINSTNRFSLRNIRFNNASNFVVCGINLFEGYGIEASGAGGFLPREGYFYLGTTGGEPSGIKFFNAVNTALGLTLNTSQYNGWGFMNTDGVSAQTFLVNTVVIECVAHICSRSLVSCGTSAGQFTFASGSCTGMVISGSQVNVTIGAVNINGFWNIARSGSVFINNAVVVTVSGTDAGIICQGNVKMQIFGGASSLTINSTASTGALQLSGDVSLSAQNLVVTANTADGAVSVKQGATLSFIGTGNSVTNPNVAGDGIVVNGSAKLLADNFIPTISAGRYGINLRGGGAAGFGAQPTTVVGGTADFTVGTAGGEDFGDATLAASLSFKTNTANSVAFRTT